MMTMKMAATLAAIKTTTTTTVTPFDLDFLTRLRFLRTQMEAKVSPGSVAESVNVSKSSPGRYPGLFSLVTKRANVGFSETVPVRLGL